MILELTRVSVLKTKIVIYGAGAIGRGFLPWIISDKYHEIIFIDKNEELIDNLNSQKFYTSYLVKNNVYEKKNIFIDEAYLPEKFDLSGHKDVIACFLAVGPRNVIEACKKFKDSNIPLILCENDYNTKSIVKAEVGYQSVYFAVPDVITSNTAPQSLLDLDRLSIVSESGILYTEVNLKNLYSDAVVIEEEDLYKRQWIPKLYLHNTPHCIAAYLGAYFGKKYIHEVMADEALAKIVEGAMNEMLEALILENDVDQDFLPWYADKELSRFRCKLLFDPVTRVAREPLRKLELDGRLIGAVQICFSKKVTPNFLILGVITALLYNDFNDPDAHIEMMYQSLGLEHFNKYILGLRTGEPLDLILRERGAEFIEMLLDMKSILNAQ